jgi:hypothetical protein
LLSKPFNLLVAHLDVFWATIQLKVGNHPTEGVLHQETILAT